ncbi:MAG: pyruvate formate lyase family protein, partial [Methylocystaceae bacterium]
MKNNAWQGFKPGYWCDEVDVRDFIQANYTPYQGDDTFLAPVTEKTRILWEKCQALLWEEHERGGILDVDTHTVSAITAHQPGYIDQPIELIVGLQTDRPLKRAIMPYGGIRMVESALEAYGYQVDKEVDQIFHQYRKTHNEGVFDAYTPEMRRARKAGIITGLPDAYGRGRIIGDYRRVALYGVDFLMAEKVSQWNQLNDESMNEQTIRSREEIAEQERALRELKTMAASYGFDICRPAANAQEAIQWLYFGYLGAIKEQNGAAMSLGRISSFLDIYFTRDLQNGLINETEAQELIDQLIIKLRLVRFLRTPDYNELFSGDPVWITEAIGGMGIDGRTLVTKTSYRFLHT